MRLWPHFVGWILILWHSASVCFLLTVQTWLLESNTGVTRGDFTFFRWLFICSWSYTYGKCTLLWPRCFIHSHVFIRFPLSSASFISLNTGSAAILACLLMNLTRFEIFSVLLVLSLMSNAAAFFCFSLTYCLCRFSHLCFVWWDRPVYVLPHCLILFGLFELTPSFICLIFQLRQFCWPLLMTLYTAGYFNL